jgi:hypothetical protein
MGLSINDLYAPARPTIDVAPLAAAYGNTGGWADALLKIADQRRKKQDADRQFKLEEQRVQDQKATNDLARQKTMMDMNQKKRDVMQEQVVGDVGNSINTTFGTLAPLASAVAGIPGVIPTTVPTGVTQKAQVDTLRGQGRMDEAAKIEDYAMKPVEGLIKRGMYDQAAKIVNSNPVVSAEFGGQTTGAELKPPVKYAFQEGPGGSVMAVNPETLDAKEIIKGEQKPIQVGPGTILLDPTTKKPIFTAPFAPNHGGGSGGSGSGDSIKEMRIYADLVKKQEGNIAALRKKAGETMMPDQAATLNALADQMEQDPDYVSTKMVLSQFVNKRLPGGGAGGNSIDHSYGGLGGSAPKAPAAAAPMGSGKAALEAMKAKKKK